MKRVLIADAVSTECDRVFADHGIEVDRLVGVSGEAIAARLEPYDAIIVRSAVMVDRAMIAAMRRTRIVGRAGAGVDNIDVEAAREAGITVLTTPGGNTTSAAEHTMALLLALLRRIPAANAALREGKWSRSAFVGSELAGKRVGMLGLGRIGRAVAARLAAFEAIVLGYDAADDIVCEGATRATFDDVLGSCDIITVHLPLTAATRGLIGAAEIGRMRDGVVLVNCARGGIIDEAALLDALNSGRVAGAAIDVFETEPPELPSPLVDHPNVVATPHLGASTREAQERVARDIAQQVALMLLDPAFSTPA